jgi:hypothetical protein
MSYKRTAEQSLLVVSSEQIEIIDHIQGSGGLTGGLRRRIQGVYFLCVASPLYASPYVVLGCYINDRAGLSKMRPDPVIKADPC